MYINVESDFQKRKYFLFFLMIKHLQESGLYTIKIPKAAAGKKEDRRKETVEDAIKKKDGKLKVVKAAEVKPGGSKIEALRSWSPS